MKLPFQRVVIHLKLSPDGVMPVSLLVLRAVQKFSECTTFNVLAIPAYSNIFLDIQKLHEVPASTNQEPSQSEIPTSGYGQNIEGCAL